MDNLIRDVINSIPNLHCAYLFGSRAKGTSTENSDYDICIIINDNNKEDAIRLITEFLLRKKEFIHPLILTKEEFKEKMKIEIYKREILENGILIKKQN